MNPMSLKEGTSLADDVYKFACDIARKNSVDAGELLLQAVWHCMKQRQKDTDQVSKEKNASTTNSSIDDSNHKSTNIDETDSACAAEDDKQNDLGRSQFIDSQSKLLMSQDASIPQSPAVQNKDGKKAENSTTKISMSDKSTGTISDKNSGEDVIDLIEIDAEKIPAKNLPSTGNELRQDYFDMDCEEIVENVDEDKDNTYQITKNLDKTDAADFYVIEDDGDGEGGGEIIADAGQEIPKAKQDIGELPPQPNNDKDEKDRKGNDVNEKVNEKGANEKSRQIKDLSNVEVIDLDSDEETEKEEKEKEADVPKNSSFQTENIEHDVKPLSIVRLFTNKSQVGNTDRANMSKTNISGQSSASETLKGSSQCSSGTELSDNYGDNMVDYEHTDMLLNVAAVGLTPIKQDFQARVSSVEYDDKTRQKRNYTEMSEETLVSQQVSYTDEGSSSPRIKKRLLDFDKKWHQAPKYGPQQDMYLAGPSGIESNKYDDVITQNLMPSIQHIEGTEFRKPGFYTSVSICSPNVVIESVDSNRPVNYNWPGGHYSTYYGPEDKCSDTEYADSDYMSDSRETHTEPKDPSIQTQQSVTGSKYSTLRGARNVRRSRVAARRGRASTWRSSSQARGSVRGRVSTEGRGSILGRGSRLLKSSGRGRSSGQPRGSVRGRGFSVLRATSRGRWSGRGRGSGQGRGSSSQRASSRGRGSGLLRGRGRGRWAGQGRGKVNPDPVIRGQAAVRVRRGRGRAVSSRGSTRGRTSNLSNKLVKDSVARSLRARGSARSRRGSRRGRGRGRGFGSVSSVSRGEDKSKDDATKSDKLPTRGKSLKVRGRGTNTSIGSSASNPFEIQDSDSEISSRGRTRKVTGTYRRYGDSHLVNSVKKKPQSAPKETNTKIVSKKLAVTAKRSAIQGRQKAGMSSVNSLSTTKKTDRQASPQNASKSSSNVSENKGGSSQLLKQGGEKPKVQNPGESLSSYVKATVQAIKNQFAKRDVESNSKDSSTVIVID